MSFAFHPEAEAEFNEAIESYKEIEPFPTGVGMNRHDRPRSSDYDSVPHVGIDHTIPPRYLTPATGLICVSQTPPTLAVFNTPVPWQLSP